MAALAVTAAPAAAQLPVPARPQTTSLDSEAPPGAPPHWLPAEEWVMQHWLPYAPSEKVRAYLDRVQRDEITDLEFSPFKADYRRLSGTRVPERPSDQGIWAAKGLQKIDWTARKGDWSVVIMNRDGSRGVDVQAKAGANAPFIRTLGWILLLPGAAVTVAGLGAIALSARGLARAGRHDVAPQPAG